MTVVFTDFGLNLANSETQPDLTGYNERSARNLLRIWDLQRNILLTARQENDDNLEVRSVVAAFTHVTEHPHQYRYAWLLPASGSYPSYFGPTYGRRLIFRVFR